MVRRKSFADTAGLLQKQISDSSDRSELEETNIQQTKKFPYAEVTHPIVFYGVI